MRLALALLALIGCSDAGSPYFGHRYVDQFPGAYAYEVAPDADTAGGVSVDTSGLAIDLHDIDGQIDSVEACLAAAFGSPPRLPAELVEAADCDGSTFPLPLRREDLTVKIAPDWIPSCALDASGAPYELLPAPAPASLCEAKGLQSSLDCPCHWRAGIEANRWIVVTPNLYLLKDPVIRMVTGCNNPWVGALAVCAHP